MKRTFFFLACVGVLAAGVARADLEKGAIAPDIEAKEWLNVDEPLSLAELRGMTVVLFFFVSFDSALGQNYMTFINVMEAGAGTGRSQGVIVIGLSDADRKRVEPILEREKAFFPVGVQTTSLRDYELSSVPRFVIINAEGKVSYSGLPSSSEDFSRAVRDAMAEAPPSKTHPFEVKRVNSLLDEAREAIRKQDYRAAYQSATDAADIALAGDSLRSKCQDYVDLLEAVARDQLASVDSFVDKKEFSEAVRALRSVSRKFDRFELGKTAATRLETLRGQYPEIAKILESQLSEAKARGLYTEAREAIESRQFGVGYKKLQDIRKDYPGSEFAAYADKITRNMEKNDLVMRDVRDFLAARDCDSWLSQARSFIAAGQFARAKELLNRIIAKYPNTRYDDLARRELANVP
ncbi:MAG: hypothetical protein U1D55_07910 [Phycisphaerae bacterium]